jgi:hypothetical protein
LHQYSWRLRLQNHVRPVCERALERLRFIQPTISTWLVPRSWTIAGTRPLASYATASSSSAVYGIGVVVDADIERASYRAAATKPCL